MLSFGIRFGKGFDEVNIVRLMQAVPREYDFDFLVIGSNPGGIACAREASLAGKRTAIVRWKIYSPAEAEGYDEELIALANALEMPTDDFQEGRRLSNLAVQYPVEFLGNTSGIQISLQRSILKSGKTTRKIRQGRLDTYNELFRRGKQCIKLMHNAVRLGDLVDDAYNSGWRLTTTRPPLTINWNKLTEEIMDFVMKENYTLWNTLVEENVNVIEGLVILEDAHTLKIMQQDMSEVEYTADLIVLALPTECIIPPDIIGARKYGITYDDFTRLSEAPGKTLVVGSTPEGMECAGIVASSRFPVTVASRSRILKGFDTEITQMIMDDLRRRGVTFREETAVVSLELSNEKKIKATFKKLESEKDSESLSTEDFETIIFTVGRRVFLRDFNLTHLGIEIDPQNHKIKVDEENQTTTPNIYVVGEMVADRPEDYEISILSGTVLGKRLFHEGKELMDYSLIPTVIYTPIEYAFVGLSEDTALVRFGRECVDAHYGFFKPLDYILPKKKLECFAKVIVLKSSDAIIGLHFYGSDAGEVVQGYAAAIRAGLTWQKFQTLIGITGSKAQEVLKLKGLRTLKKDETDLSKSF